MNPVCTPFSLLIAVPVRIISGAAANDSLVGMILERALPPQ